MVKVNAVLGVRQGTRVAALSCLSWYLSVVHSLLAFMCVSAIGTIKASSLRHLDAHRVGGVAAHSR
jgi:hypothetical protein